MTQDGTGLSVSKLDGQQNNLVQSGKPNEYQNKLTAGNPVPSNSHKRLMMLITEYHELSTSSHRWSQHTFDAVDKCKQWFIDDWQCIQDAMTPATPSQIKDCIRLLKVGGNYFDKPATAEDAKLLAVVWIGAVHEVKMSNDILALACKRWLLSPEKCFPSPGRLFEKVADVHGARNMMFNRVGNAIDYLESK